LMEVHAVAKTYGQIMQERGANLSEDAAAVRAVFEQAYDLAMQLVELRQRRGWTQAELACRCRIDQGDISRIERGSTSPTARTLQRIADALDADLRLVSRTP
jgi:ribosome-binding protein aMBF1 (putative translation factor)